MLAAVVRLLPASPCMVVCPGLLTPDRGIFTAGPAACLYSQRAEECLLERVANLSPTLHTGSATGLRDNP
jgi:hypothetical protein